VKTPWMIPGLLVILCLPAAARSRLEFSGCFKSFSTLLLQPSFKIGTDSRREADMAAVNNRLRIQLQFNPASWLSLNAAYDISPRIQDSRLFHPGASSFGSEPPGYRLDDLPSRIYPRSDIIPESFGLYQNLDRFYLEFRLKFADISLGRQAIAWGSGHIVNPTDIIAPFSFNELDTEERPGVDAVRVRIPLGILDELDFGCVAGEQFSMGKSAIFLRGKTYFLKTDVSLLAMAFREHLLLGIDLSRSLAGAGLWLEMAVVSPNSFEHDPPEVKDYFRASLGVDFNFRGSLYTFIEYHYSSAGAAQAENSIERLASPAFREGAVYLLGRHYLGLGVRKPISGLVTATGFLLANLDDPSLTVSPQLEYNIAENIYIAAGAYLGLGQNPEILPGDGSSLLHSEFGAYPDTVYASFRIYF
jgi:hypothetical protein